MTQQKYVWLFIIFFITTGCSKVTVTAVPSLGPTKQPTSIQVELSSTPTEIPLYPSVTPFTEQPATYTENPDATPFFLSQTQAPRNTAVITRTPTRTRTPTLTPTITLTPTPTSTSTLTPTPELQTELFLLQIVAPGPMSKVISPIELGLHIASEYTGLTRIELIGEDGTKLFVKPFRTYPNLGYFTRVDEKIDYEIRGAAELARLQISTFDGFGRMQAYNSVHILLQAVGETEVTTTATIQDRLLLRYPGAKEVISGSSLIVMGEYNPANDLPVMLELIDEDGKVVGSRILQLSPADGTYQSFMTSIPYEVSKKTFVRLVIRQSDDRIDGLAYLFSRVLTIGP